MANGHGLGNHPLVVIMGVMAALITVWSFVADKPPYISEFRSFVEKLIKSPPSENRRTEEANRAHEQAEQTHSEEAQRNAQEQTRALNRRRFEQQEAEAQRHAQEHRPKQYYSGQTNTTPHLEAEAQRKAQELKVDTALMEKLGLKIDKASLERLQGLGIFPSEVPLEPRGATSPTAE